MKTMTVGEFKAQFSEVITEVKNGGEIEVTFGRKKEVIGYFTPKRKIPKQQKRTLGLMEATATASFREDFRISEEEFLGL